jgi:V/A-type H+/Na+-transporting ATPase subunit B
MVARTLLWHLRVLAGWLPRGGAAMLRMLSADLHARGVYPPVDALSSLSRLMRHGAGRGRTRDDHLDEAAQILAALAQARRARELAELVGALALSPADRRYLEFEEAYEHVLVGQSRADNRSLGETLERGWRALRALPRRELAMLSSDELDAHYAAPEQEREGQSP